MEVDDSDFTPSPNTSSYLASLFEVNKKSVKGNSSLTYTPPKAPKKDSSPANTKLSKTVDIFFSKAVQAYKLENRNYISQGVTGIVISGSHDSHVYNIILYKPNKEHISYTKISKSFSLTVSPNNYVSFYDNNNVNWSIMFPQNMDLEQFVTKVAICKYYSQTDKLDFLFQDLSPVQQPQTDSNSTVDVVYNIHKIKLLEKERIKNEVRERIKLSGHSFIPFSRGLIGCGENCIRIIITPNFCNTVLVDKLEPNENLFLEIKVIKIISESQNVMPHFSEDGQESPVDSGAEETNIKAKEPPIKGSMTAMKTQKANLISRMAKMGQATLPVKQNLTHGLSDSEEENPLASIKPRLPRTRGAMTNPHQTASIPQISTSQKPETQQLSLIQNDMTWQQSQLAKLGVAYQQFLPVSSTPVSSPMSDTNFSVYVSESRVHTAELRMGISKISDKLDLVWNKLQNLNSAPPENKSQQSLLTDPSGILTSIQTLIKENETLKNKVEEQKEKIEQQNDKIYQLLELNHKYLEKTLTPVEKESESESKLKTQIETLNKREAQLVAENKEGHAQIKSLEKESEAMTQERMELKKKVEILTEEIEKYKFELEKNNDVNKKELQNWEEKMTKAMEAFVKLKEKLREVTLENENLKALMKAQKVEIDVKKEEVEDSLKKNEEFEKTVENLKKQISEEEIKSGTKIDDLSKTVAKLEEENNSLLLQIKQQNQEKEVEDVVLKTFTLLTTKFSDFKEYSGSAVLSTIRECFQEVSGISLPNKQPPKNIKDEKTEDVTIDGSFTVMPTPDTSIQNIEVKQKPQDLEATKTSNLLPEKEIKDKSIENEKKEIVSSQTSYDQGWRTAKPPPPPLFDDEDDSEGLEIL